MADFPGPGVPRELAAKTSELAAKTSEPPTIPSVKVSLGYGEVASEKCTPRYEPRYSVRSTTFAVCGVRLNRRDTILRAGLRLVRFAGRDDPARFRHQRPTPPKLPTVAWINQPTPEALIKSA